MRKVFALLTLVLLLTGSALASVDVDHLITPGVGIGNVTLGEHIEDVIALLGAPREKAPIDDGGTFYSWVLKSPSDDNPSLIYIHRGGYEVVANKDGIVFGVAIANDEKFTTAEGLHTGTMYLRDLLHASVESDVVDALGNPNRTRWHSQSKDGNLRGKRVWYSGIGFEFESWKGRLFQVSRVFVLSGQ